jgi:hypothetical protein
MKCRILHALCGTQIYSAVIYWNPKHELHDLFPDIEFHVAGKRGFMDLIGEMADYTAIYGCGLFLDRGKL